MLYAEPANATRNYLRPISMHIIFIAHIDVEVDSHEAIAS